MNILNEEHFENVRRYAESIGDTSLQKCLERLKAGKKTLIIPAKSHSTMTMPHTRSALPSTMPMEKQAS